MVPETRAAVTARGVPPVEVVYHFIAVPVATKSATVGLLIEQKDCDALPVGAAGLATVTATDNLVALSHPATVCEA